MENRKFKCYNCNYEWDLPHGNGQMGINLSCPKCNSSNVHRLNSGRHGGRRGVIRPRE
ncbi:MAG: hydrogenase maturation nickel metallochaperone HypA [Candidatus Methanofastidiosa archaeon]|nr:hydrogenase maturation nickel metallochaperone HypA [Candidatus Methanofastidiosa archaeon]NYT14061.1 hydrogenase maturation nickel metallochaperone HypA [Candidatus Methanofastidiosa archaeon]